MASDLQPSATTTRRALLLVEGFVAVVAVVGGIGLAATHGLGLPDRVLASTPFDRWVVLGLALAVVVGGAQLPAAWAVATRRPAARILSFAAGGVLVAWILGELVTLGLGTPWQLVMFAAGVATIALAWRLPTAR
jgi:hypothetical protein